MMGKHIYCGKGTEYESADSWRDVFTALKNEPNSAVTISPGVYEVTDALARKTQSDVMSDVYGDNPEKAMFSPDFLYSKGVDLSGLSDITIEAFGVTLMVDGFMEPLSVTDCENVTVKGLTIDHKRKPYSKSVINSTVFTDKADGAGYINVTFGDEYPIENGTPMPRACIFDINANRFTLYGEIKLDEKNRKELSPQVWQFPFKNLYEDITGSELYVWHTFHSRPAILIENSRNITLENVTVHSQPGMGIVAHRCENLYFNRLSVIPSNGEHMSTNTDATHITSCKGTVEYNNCRFEGQGDDTVNIHTYYHRIKNVRGNVCTIYLDAPTGTHSQTADYPDNGDILELTDALSLKAHDTYKVLECKSTDYRTSELILDKPLPISCEDMYFADVTHLPKFYFHDCVCHSHLARSVLSKVKNAVIEDNWFIDVVGTAICVTAEGYWREGLCSTESIAIRRNKISFGGRTNSIKQSGSGGITVTVSAKNPTEVVHKNVIIEDNLIDCPHSPHGIYVSNTANLTLERNHVVSKEEPAVIEAFAVPDE